MTDFWARIERGKELCVKRDKCEDFAEYSWKHGLLEDVYAKNFFFDRYLYTKRNMFKTFQHIFKALKEAGE